MKGKLLWKFPYQSMCDCLPKLLTALEEARLRPSCRRSHKI